MQKASRLHKANNVRSGEIQKIIDWLTTYPAFEDIFDVSKESSGQLIDYNGTDELEHEYFMRRSGEKISYRNNYVLQVNRPFLDRIQRKENADFLTDFQKWVRNQNQKDLVPRLGNHGYQNAYVDSQEFVDSEESDGTALYEVQLHIEYNVLLFKTEEIK